MSWIEWSEDQLVNSEFVTSITRDKTEYEQYTIQAILINGATYVKYFEHEEAARKMFKTLKHSLVESKACSLRYSPC